MIPRSLKKPLLLYKPVKRLFKRFTSQRTDKEFRNAKFSKANVQGMEGRKGKTKAKKGNEKKRKEIKREIRDL